MLRKIVLSGKQKMKQLKDNRDTFQKNDGEVDLVEIVDCSKEEIMNAIEEN